MLKKFVLYALAAFVILVFLQQVDRFHREKNLALLPDGHVIWRAGRLDGAKPETLEFSRTYDRDGRHEMRLKAWSLTGGRLEVNGGPLGDLPPDRAVFFRLDGERIRDRMAFRAVIPSPDGSGAFWLSEMTGLGTDATWTCIRDGLSVPIRVWGKPPLYPWRALQK